jgi:hypothetical protein
MVAPSAEDGAEDRSGDDRGDNEPEQRMHTRGQWIVPEEALIEREQKAGERSKEAERELGVGEPREKAPLDHPRAHVGTAARPAVELVRREVIARAAEVIVRAAPIEHDPMEQVVEQKPDAKRGQRDQNTEQDRDERACIEAPHNGRARTAHERRSAKTPGGAIARLRLASGRRRRQSHRDLDCQDHQRLRAVSPSGCRSED